MKHFTKPPLGTPLNPAHPLNRGLVLYMPFNEGAGSKTQDLSGKGNHGTLTNMVQSATSGWTGGKFGGSMRFDGVDDYIATDKGLNVTGASSRTICLWFKQDSLITKYLVGFGAVGEAQLFDFGLYQGVLILHAYGGGYDTISGAPAYTVGVWNFASITYNGVDVVVFLNGNFGNKKTLALNTANSILWIGRGLFEPTNYFNGTISDVRIYNRALSAQEVQQLYTDPFCMYESKGISRWAQLIKKGSFFFR